MPEISVIVPIYNVAAYIHQCVGSILGQTFKNIEVILVNDGSTDNSIEICEYFHKSDSRVKLINQQNQGLVGARKSGLNKSTGKYVFYVDGDDWIDHDCLHQFYTLAEKNKTDIVISDYKRAYMGKFLKVKNSIVPGLYDWQRIESEIIPNMISKKPFFNHGIRTYSWGKLYKRELIIDLQNSVPDVFFGEDAALTYVAIAHSKRILITDLTLYNYRQRSDSILKIVENTENEITQAVTICEYLFGALHGLTGSYDLIAQLKEYFVYSLIIRTGGGFDHNVFNYNEFSVFGDLKKGSKLAIYNSGSFGQNVWSKIVKNPFFEFVAWFDNDYYENNLLGMPVKDPQNFYDYDFDYLIFASFDENLKSEVCQHFLGQGLCLEKIKFPSLEALDLKSFEPLLRLDFAV